jgi:MFS family permease
VLLGISRLFLIFFLFTPYFPAYIQPWLFVCLIGAMNLPDAISQSSLQSYLGDVFDGRSRALAISARSKFGTVVVLIVTLSTGLIIGLLPRTDGQIMLLYQIFFALAFTVGIFEILSFLKLKPKNPSQPDKPIDEKPKALTSAKTVFRDKKFIKFLTVTIIFYVTWHAGWPLGAIIQIIELGANELWLALFAVVNGIVAFFSAGRWNKLMIKKGSNYTLTVAAFLIALNALCIAFVPNNFLLLLTFIIGGAAGIGANMSLLNGLLESTPSQNRIFYFGIFNTLVNLSLAISPFVAHYLVTQMGPRWALFTVGGGRIFSALLLMFVFIIIPQKPAPHPDKP